MHIILWNRWGCDHEQSALEAYKIKSALNHSDLKITPAGLFLDVEKPYIGASPDSLVSCSCCGQGIVEVKCPFVCCKDGPSEENQSFMANDGSKWTLQPNHAYFYQVQTQLHVCGVKYCDFVVWTEKGVSMERIEVDPDFFVDVAEHVEHFFKYSILPEIIGKWLTRKPVADACGVVEKCLPSTSAASNEQEIDRNEDYEKAWCFCCQPSFGTMIKCDNDNCTIEWFHCECLRIRGSPKGKWYCPACRRLPQLSKKPKPVKKTKPTKK